MGANNLQDRVAKLVAALGSGTDAEIEIARRALDHVLIRPAPFQSWPGQQSDSSSDADINPLDLVCVLLEEYVDLKPHEYVAVAAWILHTHVYEQFTVTPRLLATSPVRAFGKSTLLRICAQLVAHPSPADSITATVIYHEVDSAHPTLLLDDDNLGLLINGNLRTMFNGNYKGARVKRLIGGRSRTFHLFAPMFIAAIGTTATLPLPRLTRSIVIKMERSTKKLMRLDPDNPDPAFHEAYRCIIQWARTVSRALLDRTIYNTMANR